jgi:hypothetical protein
LKFQTIRFCLIFLFTDKLLIKWRLPHRNSDYGAQIGIGIDPKTKLIVNIGAFDTDSIKIRIAGHCTGNLPDALII